MKAIRQKMNALDDDECPVRLTDNYIAREEAALRLEYEEKSKKLKGRFYRVKRRLVRVMSKNERQGRQTDIEMTGSPFHTQQPQNSGVSSELENSRVTY